MSRSVSAPSSVTKTSPCWKGLIVPGSTFRYGSNFCTCTRSPRAFNRRPSEAAVIPLPSDETTPPVTKTYFVGRALTLPPSQSIEVREACCPLDQRAERAPFAEDVEAGDCYEQRPATPSVETLHGLQA